MVAGAVGGILKFRYLFLIWAGLYVFGSLAMGIYSGAVHYSKTGEVKPLVEATIGRVVGSDYIISQNVERLQNTSIDSKLATFLRQEITQSLLLMVLMWYLLYLLFSVLIKLGISDASMNIWIKLFLIFVSLIILLIASALYNGFYLDRWAFPFEGIIDLIKNRDIVFTNIGITPNIPELTNETINNITGG